MDHKQFVTEALERRYRGRASLDWYEVAVTAIEALFEYDAQISAENGFAVRG